MQKLKEQLEKYAFPLILGIIASLAYGLFAFQQGFYWDDWAYSWTRAHFGTSGIIDMISYNRTVRAYWEGLMTPIIGL